MLSTWDKWARCRCPHRNMGSQLGAPADHTSGVLYRYTEFEPFLHSILLVAELNGRESLKRSARRFPVSPRQYDGRDAQKSDRDCDLTPDPAGCQCLDAITVAPMRPSRTSSAMACRSTRSRTVAEGGVDSRCDRRLGAPMFVHSQTSKTPHDSKAFARIETYIRILARFSSR